MTEKDEMTPMIDIKNEIDKKLIDIHKKSLNREYISLGTFIRFRDFARQKTLNEVIKLIDERIKLSEYYVRERKEWIFGEFKELKSKLSEMK